MKQLTLLTLLFLSITGYSQTKFRTLNHWIIDSTGKECFDSFNFVRVIITLDSQKVRIQDRKTFGVVEYTILRIEDKTTHRIAYLSNGEMAYFNDCLKRFYIKNNYRIREYRKW